MTIIGKEYSVELERKKTHGNDWSLLKFISADGTVRTCMWQTDAGDTELAYALRIFANKLEQDKNDF